MKTKSTVAAYRAHRARLVASMKGASRTVKAELARKVAVYDRTIAALAGC